MPTRPVLACPRLTESLLDCLSAFQRPLPQFRANDPKFGPLLDDPFILRAEPSLPLSCLRVFYELRTVPDHLADVGGVPQHRPDSRRAPRRDGLAFSQSWRRNA